jgi:hypothetical protein
LFWGELNQEREQLELGELERPRQLLAGGAALLALIAELRRTHNELTDPAVKGPARLFIEIGEISQSRQRLDRGEDRGIRVQADHRVAARGRDAPPDKKFFFQTGALDQTEQLGLRLPSEEPEAPRNDRLESLRLHL